MLTGFKTFDLFGTFLPIGIGAEQPSSFFSKLMDHALNNYHSVFITLLLELCYQAPLILIPNVEVLKISNTLDFLS